MTESLVRGLPAFWVAFGAAALVAWPIYAALLKFKSRQAIYEFAPESHQVKQGTPTMGGLIILVGLVASLAAYGGRLLVPGLVLILGFAAIGFIDDFVVPKLMKSKRGLGWKQKLVLEVAAALGAVWLYLPNPSVVPAAVGVFIVLFVANAYNFADGLDALAGSLLVGLAVGLALLCDQVGWGEGMIVSLALIGAVLPFLYLNAPPAKVFMGDVGALPIGALLGLLFVGLMGPSGGSAPVDWLPLVILGFMMVAELVPVPMQVGYYKLTKKRLFPFTPIHHAFEKKGWKETRVVWTFALTQLLLSALAVTLARGGG